MIRVNHWIVAYLIATFLLLSWPLHGTTAVQAEPAAGKANWNIHAMARDGLRHELADLLKRAPHSEGQLAVRGLIQRDENGKPSQALDLTAQAMPDPGPLSGTVLLTFHTLPLPAVKRRARSSNPLVLELEQQLAQARLPYISVMTDPTTGGVSASLAMLGDLNIAEPRALIGFAGPRTIKATIRIELPKGFQTSEFLLEHGFIDRIVPRRDLQSEIAAAIDYCGK